MTIFWHHFHTYQIYDKGYWFESIYVNHAIFGFLLFAASFFNTGIISEADGFAFSGRAKNDYSYFT